MMRIDTTVKPAPVIKVHLHGLDVDGISHPLSSDETPEDPLEAFKHAEGLGRNVYMHVASSGNYDRDLFYPLFDELAVVVANTNGDSNSVPSVNTAGGNNILIIFEENVVFQPGTTMSNPFHLVETPTGDTVGESFGTNGDGNVDDLANGGYNDEEEDSLDEDGLLDQFPDDVVRYYHHRNRNNVHDQDEDDTEDDDHDQDEEGSEDDGAQDSDDSVEDVTGYGFSQLF